MITMMMMMMTLYGGRVLLCEQSLDGGVEVSLRTGFLVFLRSD